jgi:hypothetical protein
MPDLVWYAFIAVAALVVVFATYADLNTYAQFTSNESLQDCAQYKPVIDFAKKCVAAKAQISVDCGAIVIQNFTGTAETWPKADLGVIK